jgi:hypothetical protein
MFEQAPLGLATLAVSALPMTPYPLFAQPADDAARTLETLLSGEVRNEYRSADYRLVVDGCTLTLTEESHDDGATDTYVASVSAKELRLDQSQLNYSERQIFVPASEASGVRVSMTKTNPSPREKNTYMQLHSGATCDDQMCHAEFVASHFDLVIRGDWDITYLNQAFEALLQLATTCSEDT